MTPQSASEINSMVDTAAVGKKFKTGTYDAIPKMAKKKMKPKDILLVLFI